MTRSSERWAEQLAFRDALRDDPALCERYAALKRELAARHRDEREAYTDAKTTFVRAVLRGAEGVLGPREASPVRLR